MLRPCQDHAKTMPRSCWDHAKIMLRPCNLCSCRRSRLRHCYYATLIILTHILSLSLPSWLLSAQILGIPCALCLHSGSLFIRGCDCFLSLINVCWQKNTVWSSDDWVHQGGVRAMWVSVFADLLLTLFLRWFHSRFLDGSHFFVFRCMIYVCVCVCEQKCYYHEWPCPVEPIQF